jgi:hypothetical protein
MEFQAAVARAIKIKQEDMKALTCPSNDPKPGKLSATDADGKLLPGFVTQGRMAKVGTQLSTLTTLAAANVRTLVE